MNVAKSTRDIEPGSVHAVQKSAGPSDAALRAEQDPLKALELSDPLQAIQLKQASGVPQPGSSDSSGSGLSNDVLQMMESSFGADFSSVQVHIGGEAGARGAKAFTQGEHIHFGSGQYDPSSPSGRELIGHELSHVVQQRAGRVAAPQAKGSPVNANPSLEREADVAGARAAKGRPAGIDEGGSSSSGAAIQLKQLDTYGGVFEADQYEAITGAFEKVSDSDLKSQTVGAVMDLSFNPAKEVKGKFGLVQVGHATRTTIAGNQKVDLEQGEKMDRTTDDGWFLDRSKGKENPIFGMQNQQDVVLGGLAGAEGIDMSHNRNAVANKEGASINKTSAPKTAGGQTETYNDSGRVSDKAGVVGQQTDDSTTPATLRDEPARDRKWDPKQNKGDAIKMEFETSALGLDGDIKDTYLGSVRWGFTIDTTDKKAKPLPFSLASKGTPTKTFAKAVQKWNEQEETRVGNAGNVLTLPVGASDFGVDDDYMDRLESSTNKDDIKIQRLQELQNKFKILSQQILDEKEQELQDSAGVDLAEIHDQISKLRQEQKDIGEESRNLNETYSHLNKTRRELAEAVKAAKTDVEAFSGMKRILHPKQRKRAKQKLESAQRCYDDVSSTRENIMRRIDETARLMLEKERTIKDLMVSASARNHREKLVTYMNLHTTFQTTRFEITALKTELKI